MMIEVVERWSGGGGDTENELASNMLLTIMTGTMKNMNIGLSVGEWSWCLMLERCKMMM